MTHPRLQQTVGRARVPRDHSGLGSHLLAASSSIVLVIALLAPSTDAAVVLPPYHRATVVIQNYTSWSGCVGLNVSKPPVFHPRGGVLSLKASGSLQSCPASLVANRTVSSLQWDGGWTITIPINFSTSGTHLVNTSWAFNWLGVTGYSLRRACSGTPNASASYSYLSCQAFAGVSWDGITSVVDQTNGNVYWSSGFFPGALNISSWFWSEHCLLGCKITHSASATNGSTVGPSAFNSSVTVSVANASHKYALVIGLTAQLLIDVFTNAYQFHGVVRLLATAHGSINLAPPRNGGQLVSISVR